MNNDDLDRLLKQRLSPLRNTELSESIAPSIMQQIRLSEAEQSASAEIDASLVADDADIGVMRDWVLAVAWLAGGLIGMWSLVQLGATNSLPSLLDYSERLLSTGSLIDSVVLGLAALVAFGAATIPVGYVLLDD